MEYDVIGEISDNVVVICDAIVVCSDVVFRFSDDNIVASCVTVIFNSVVIVELSDVVRSIVTGNVVVVDIDESDDAT